MPSYVYNQNYSFTYCMMFTPTCVFGAFDILLHLFINLFTLLFCNTQMFSYQTYCKNYETSIPRRINFITYLSWSWSLFILLSLILVFFLLRLQNISWLFGMNTCSECTIKPYLLLFLDPSVDVFLELFEFVIVFHLVTCRKY